VPRGRTSSANSAALSAIRRAQQLGQKPRFLQLKATNFSSWQDSHRTLRNPFSSRPHFKYSSNSLVTYADKYLLSFHFQRYSLQLTGTVSESGTCTCELRISRPINRLDVVRIKDLQTEGAKYTYAWVSWEEHS